MGLIARILRWMGGHMSDSQESLGSNLTYDDEGHCWLGSVPMSGCGVAELYLEIAAGPEGPDDWQMAAVQEFVRRYSLIQEQIKAKASEMLRFQRPVAGSQQPDMTVAGDLLLVVPKVQSKAEELTLFVDTTNDKRRTATVSVEPKEILQIELRNWNVVSVTIAE